MSSTDNRIVKMQFDNDTFKKKAAETKQSLADVNKAIDAAGKHKGLLDLSSNMQRVSVTASNMAIATTTALGTIANKVTNVALQMADSLTFAPLRQGFSEYESLLTKQNTIMNSTGKSAAEVQKILKQLNDYSDQTIYSFGNMTDAVTKFTNAGVPLDRAVMSIKGIANAAAFAGASSEEASRAMIGFSQAIGTGFMGLMDWTQIENANMGTVRFKQQLLDAAVAAGTLTKRGKEYITQAGTVTSATKGWRDALQDQWLTTEVLNDTLGKYTDETTALGRRAAEAATEVRTFSAFMDTLKESIGSGWSNIFTSLFGNLEEATAMWTGLSNAVGHVVEDFFSWTSSALSTWRTMGGFEKTMEGFRNLLAPIGAILDVIGTAFRTAFPNSGDGSGKALYGLSAGFAAITTPLQWLADIIRLLTSPMTIFFQIIKIGGEAVGEAVGFIKDFVSAFAGLVDVDVPGAGIIDWIKQLGGAIKDTLAQITYLLDRGSSLKDAFSSVSLPDLPSLPNMPKINMPSIGGDDSIQKGAASLGGMSLSLEGLGRLLQKVADFFKGLASSAEDAGGTIASVGEAVAGAFKTAFGYVADILARISMEDVVSSFNMSILATFLISLTRLINTFSKSYAGFMGMGEAVNGLVTDAGSALKSFQTAARAKLILNIALALLVLAGALWILSKIPADSLVKALAALSGVALLLNVSMKSLANLIEKMDGDKFGFKTLAISVAILAMGAAMIMLAGACLIFNHVDWESVAKALTVMGVMMASFTLMGKFAEKGAGSIAASALALTAMSVSMTILAGALMLFEFVKWESLGKAGVAFAAIMAAFLAIGAVVATGAGAAAIAAAGFAMAAASGGMTLLAGALMIFEKVKWKNMAKAGVALVGLAAGLALMSVGVAAAAVMPLIGVGLIAIATALQILDGVEWASIGKLVVVMIAFAAGLAVLTPVLYLAAPALILFGVAMMSIGGGLFLFVTALSAAMVILAGGATAFSAFAIAAAVAFTAFMQTLALEAPLLKKAFLTILQELINTIVEAVPMVIQGIKDLWKAVVAEFAGDESKKGMKDAGSGAVTSIGDGVEKEKPSLIRRAANLIIDFLNELSKDAARFTAAAANLVIKMIEGLNTKVGDFVKAAVKFAVNFASALAGQTETLAKAAIDFVVRALNSLASAIETRSNNIGKAVTRITKAMIGVGRDIVAGLAQGIIESGKDTLSSAIDTIISPLPSLAEKILGIESPSKVFARIGEFLTMGLTQGIQNNAAAAITAVASMVGGQIAIANEYVNGFIQSLDQKAIAARAKADGLARAAAKAQAAANKTKDKRDDAAADKLSAAAAQADKVADAAEKQASDAKAAEDRAATFESASYLEKAQIRSEDAQRELDAAKAYEARAASKLVEANALDRQARAAGVTPAQRAAMEKQADQLRAEAKKDAATANARLEAARKAAADALAYQKLAGDEAAAAFQAAFDADAKAAADEAAFEKMSDQEKADLRRQQAAELQAKATADLEKAKQLAYTDIEAANAMAELAQAEADRARDYLDQAVQLELGTGQGSGGVLGTVVNMAPTDAAALAMREYSNMYSAATAAAAATKTVEFNQYNTSPEALSPSEIYRQTNNLLTDAVDKIDAAA